MRTRPLANRVLPHRLLCRHVPSRVRQNVVLAWLLLLPLMAAACSTPAANPAANTPDQFAWQLFAEINQPIPNDPQGRVQWEGWALASKVFGDPKGTPDWDTVSATATPRMIQELDPTPLQLQVEGPDNARNPDLSTFDPDASPDGGDESRMNRATFDFILQNNLWYVEGQEAFFAANRSLSFPVASREIKAQWRRIQPEEAARYHTATFVNADGEKLLFGLTALHVITKDLPNWFWATWEQKDNPDIDAVIPSRDSAGLPAQLKGTVWENYILRGTQIDFVDATGRPTRLANTQIEGPFQATSSCITCHARSTIGPRPQDPTVFVNRLSIFDPAQLQLGHRVGLIGVPDPAWFFDTSSDPATRKYAQLDFVWSLFRADRRNP